jgi:hypothetical protein
MYWPSWRLDDAALDKVERPAALVFKITLGLEPRASCSPSERP